ncbi:hypothetical protein [Lapidilactobacillus salsurivasis]
MKLSFAAPPLRTRPDFETSRALCGLAQNSAHRVPAAINVLRRLRPPLKPTTSAIKRKLKRKKRRSPGKGRRLFKTIILRGGGYSRGQARIR